MSLIQFNNVGIKALAAALPKNKIKNYEQTEFFQPEEVKNIVDKIGVYERRFASTTMCSSDLCQAAAERLISDNSIDRSEVDLLVFISQTPDYRMPATSIILQNKLRLPNTTIAFDINLGCSGFLYGMSVVYAMMQNSNLKKALLLNGETRSKVYSSKDRTTAFIFGDAGVAALIERDTKFAESTFSLNSDGSRENLIKINAGGYRNPSSTETLKEKIVDKFGNIRSEEHGYMKGGDVFTFVNREIPQDIQNILQFTNKKIDDFDYFVFHQANKFINSHLIKKLNLDSQKIPSTIHKYGNTSSVSVPLTIVSELRGKMANEKLLLMSAFGVGMTWATAIVPFVELKISDIVEI